MIKKFFLLFIGTFLLIITLLAMPLFSQKINSDSCRLYVDSISLREAIIIDNTIYNIIDSALSLIKIEPVENHNIPYYFQLYPIDDGIPGNVRVVIQANNWFANKQDFKDAEQEFYRDAILIRSKKANVLVSKLDCDTWLRGYIRFGNNREVYHVYSFFNENRTMRCSPAQLLRQKVTFSLWKGHRKPFSFDEYSYSIHDDTFIYDNELVEKR